MSRDIQTEIDLQAGSRRERDSSRQKKRQLTSKQEFVGNYDGVSGPKLERRECVCVGGGG